MFGVARCRRLGIAALQGELLETVGNGVVAFFSVQPAMLDQIPQLGHIPKLFKAMTSRNDAIPKSALRIVQQLANSDVSPNDNNR